MASQNDLSAQQAASPLPLPLDLSNSRRSCQAAQHRAMAGFVDAAAEAEPEWSRPEVNEDMVSFPFVVPGGAI
jgi:hypothetical protein